MTVPVNNVGMSHIQSEYGGDGSISLTEYYRGGSYVPVNQLKSIHTTKEIPLLSNGATQEISIGMFRGTAKKFKWVFNITQDRYNTFNLHDELVQVGWDGVIPVDVTINISMNVYVVSINPSTPTIDVTFPFDQSSELLINNSGFIYGRGGRGGQGGIFDTINGERGEDGGTAISTVIRTKINNLGVIAGGGGGGGGAGAAIKLQTIDIGGEMYRTDASYYLAPSGGGGAPFGAAGPSQSQHTYSNVVADQYAGPQSASNASSASVSNRGSAGIMANSYDTTRICIAGFGGMPGSSGMPAHHPGGTFGGNLWSRGGEGGQAGFALIGGSNVEWVKFGSVLGRYDNLGKMYNSSSQNIIGLYTANSQNKSVSEVYRVLPKTTNQGSGQASYSTLTQNWSSSLGDILYSYSSTTSWNDLSSLNVAEFNNINNQWNFYGRVISPICSQYGSELKMVRYFCVVENPSIVNVRLYGLADDRITFVNVNGVTKITNNNGIINYSSAQNSSSFDLPPGPCIVEVGVRDDNGGVGNNFGNAHMIGLYIKSLPYDQVLIEPKQWHVRYVENI